MTGTLFEITFYLAAPFWLLMIFAPRWSVTTRIASSPLTVLPLLAVYTVLAVQVFPELWTAVSTPDIDTFRELAALAEGAGALWAQVIAWDLLVGQWMFLQSRKLGLSPWLMGPLLVFTILLSPFGLLVFLALRTVRQGAGRRGADRPQDQEG
ncbi:ABA4-like family protein [Streptomyces cyaneofuscatus]|uniref:ABA4-like family protein n=1 Tax=Streptomyces cyaneofuscatus TaxID=66883 RepID=UPI0033DC7194